MVRRVRRISIDPGVVKSEQGVEKKDLIDIVKSMSDTDDAVAKMRRRRNAVSHEERYAQVVQSKQAYSLRSPCMPKLHDSSALLFYSVRRGIRDDKQGGEDQFVVDCVNNVEIGSVAALRQIVRSTLYSRKNVLNVEVRKGTRKPVRTLPGRLLGQSSNMGPAPAPIMIVSKMPGRSDMECGLSFSGDEMNILAEALDKAHFGDLSGIYATYFCKFESPGLSTTLSSAWKKDGLYLLMHEIAIVRPKYLLCLGADVTTALFGSENSVTKAEGRVLPLTPNVAFSEVEEPRNLSIKAMVTINPRQVMRDPAAIRQLESGISRFVSLTKGVDIGGGDQTNHKVVDTYEELFNVLCEIESDPEKTDSWIAVDAEWHGEHPQNANAYLRTIQLSWKHAHAIGIIINGPGGIPLDTMTHSPREICEPLKELLTKFFLGGEVEGVKFRPKRVCGHYFNSDLEQLIEYGIDISPAFFCTNRDLVVDENTKLGQLYKQFGFKHGSTVPSWFRTKFEGGADTAYMCHAIEETADFSLETLAIRYTTASRYDEALSVWKKAHCAANGLSEKTMGGYGDCPDEVLLPYGMYDADVTLRLFYIFDDLLDNDYEGNCCREAFWETQCAAPAILEIHRTGIKLNRDKTEYFSDLFLDKMQTMIAELRQQVRNPDLNINSSIQVGSLFFGPQYFIKDKSKIDEGWSDGTKVCLRLKPVLTTSKPPKQWDSINPKFLDEYTPAVNTAVVALLIEDLTGKGSNLTHDQKFALSVLEKYRDCKFLSTALKTILRPPRVDPKTGERIVDASGNYVYDKGLSSFLCDDGKLRTHIYPTKETGRWSSARPPLQVFAKKREADYKRILGDDYRDGLRSILEPDPGHVMMATDLKGAELFGMAVLSGDEKMISHVFSNQLSEDDPNYYDIHSNVAVLAFKLKCPPTKAGLKSIGKAELRQVAKAVIFGVAYGRGAPAIVVEAKQQGTVISVDEAQDMIDALFNMYPGLRRLFHECRSRAVGEFVPPGENKPAGRYLISCFGRYRRFPATNDKGIRGEFERQAMNFPLQGLVASVCSRAVANFDEFHKNYVRRTGKSPFKFLLQVHDELIFSVPYEFVGFMARKVIPLCMRRMIPIYPSDLGGNWLGTGPFYMGLETEVMDAWGVAMSTDKALKLGLPTGKEVVNGSAIVFSEE